MDKHKKLDNRKNQIFLYVFSDINNCIISSLKQERKRKKWMIKKQRKAKKYVKAVCFSLKNICKIIHKITGDGKNGVNDKVNVIPSEYGGKL